MSIVRYENSNSDMLQESFVISMLQEKRNGHYVEIGSGDPIISNNTYILEKYLNWNGLALDLNKAMCDKYNKVRTNKSICEDAISFDYKSYFQENSFPNQIDFLQIDIDNGGDNPDHLPKTQYINKIMDATGNLLSLISLPLTTYRFSVIIFEHEYITNYKNKEIRNAQREILNGLNYKLIGQTGLEDWWIDPTAISLEVYKNEYFISNTPFVEHTKRIERLGI